MNSILDEGRDAEVSRQNRPSPRDPPRVSYLRPKNRNGSMRDLASPRIMEGGTRAVISG